MSDNIVEKLKKEINELKKNNDFLKEDIQTNNLIDQQHRKLNGELMQVNKQLRKEIEEVKRDNKKLAHHIEDRMDRSRKAGM